MNAFFLISLVAVLATIAVLVRGIILMARGGDEDYETSTRLMFRRTEFQAAGVAAIIAGVAFAGGWLQYDPPANQRLSVEVGLMSARALHHNYDADSAELTAYGGIPDRENDYLLTVVISDKESGERVSDARVSATVGPLGHGGSTRDLQMASFGGVPTFGNVFRMPQTGLYEIDISVDRADVPGTDFIRLKHRRP